MAKRADPNEETVTEETVVRRTTVVKEWTPQATETLPEIQTTIDSWGRPTVAARAAPLDHAQVEAKVDRIVRRVKGSRKQVVTETVTEWVERPVERQFLQVSPVLETETEAEPGHRAGRHGEGHEAPRPRGGKRRFRALGFFGPRPAKADKDEEAGTESEAYQPQCSALTEEGAQCRNSARGSSRYCSSHKGYQPPTAKGLAQRIEGNAWDPSDGLSDRASVAAADTRPRVHGARDTKVRVRKAGKGRKAR